MKFTKTTLGDEIRVFDGFYSVNIIYYNLWKVIGNVFDQKTSQVASQHTTLRVRESLYGNHLLNPIGIHVREFFK